MENRRKNGSRYEERAAAYLESQGLCICGRNFRTPRGEIDLIAREDGVLCFVEVKGRKNAACGYPAEAVHAHKQLQIRKTAVWYLASHGLPEETPCRFDVVSICGEEISFLRNAF